MMSHLQVDRFVELKQQLKQRKEENITLAENIHEKSSFFHTIGQGISFSLAAVASLALAQHRKLFTTFIIVGAQLPVITQGNGTAEFTILGS